MTRLKVWRLDRGLSQVELSAVSNVPRYIIQLAEQGIRALEPNEAEALALCLGVQPHELIRAKTSADLER